MDNQCQFSCFFNFWFAFGGAFESMWGSPLVDAEIIKVLTVQHVAGIVIIADILAASGWGIDDILI